ncbi:hypothetical protein SAMN04488104_104316 [Algoriphagus faecimaris]|uniref:6-bladed beta-propeller protein n=1 Tax=Algoriphagus faecimaris TaxID=686796 RepID=A0A1G6WD82_9BACT|nr:6-bladed beta-propeller [Algoriphagus faecimaris]SDD63768.1 hypothetical protein SAMN04488104_104316 [Algoriphagus faecimaris]
MKYLNFGLILVFALCVSSCSTDSEVSDSSIYINLENVEKTNWEDIFDDIEVIPLEFTSESMLVNIHKILMLDGDYILFDKDQSVVYKFDSKGKYLSKLDKLGSAPGEYQSLYDMLINPYTNNIELLSPTGSIYTYNKDFEWIETIDIEGVRSVHKFEYYAEDIIALFSNDNRLESNFLLYSTKENRLIKKIKFEPSVFEINQIMMLGNPLIHTGEDLLYCIPFSNKVNTMDINGVKSKYIWDFGKYNFDAKDLNSNSSRDEVLEVMSYNAKNNFSTFYNYTENAKLVFAQFIFKNKFCSMVFAKESGEYRVINDFMPTETISLVENSLVSYTHIDQLNKILESNPKGSYGDLSLLRSEFENNPFLLVYRFKSIY